MKPNLNRRLFLKRAALTAGAFSTTRFLSAPNILQAASPSDKLNCAIIGCGGRGLSEHVKNVAGENIIAIVDVSEKQHALAKTVLAGKGQDNEKLQAFTDYRQMFDKIPPALDRYMSSPIRAASREPLYRARPSCANGGLFRDLRAVVLAP